MCCRSSSPTSLSCHRVLFMMVREMLLGVFMLGFHTCPLDYFGGIPTIGVQRFLEEHLGYNISSRGFSRRYIRLCSTYHHLWAVYVGKGKKKSSSYLKS